MRRHPVLVLACVCLSLAGCRDEATGPRPGDPDGVRALLLEHGVTGNVEGSLAARLGRAVNPELADLGRLLFFDRALGLHSDPDGSNGNSCAGCHSPSTGFGDTQSIAIGVDNNSLVGPGRSGPRNQRRSPMLVNIAFAPRLMWDGRFSAPSGDPFDNSQGYVFPDPEGTTAFPANDPAIRHLLVAQAHIPPTELPEMAGFTGTSSQPAVSFTGKQLLRRGMGLGADALLSITDIFDDGHGQAVPAPDENGFRNAQIRDAVTGIVNGIQGYRDLFAALYQDVADGGPISYLMIAQAMAEFQISLTFANAPVDQFARGDDDALTEAARRGAVVFFGKGKCAGCHASGGESNEMFSDFRNHRIGGPPLAPEFGPGLGNVQFAGAGQMEDFGAEHSTGDALERYMFRTTPIRNVAVQPTFFHNGAYTTLEAAIRHHLDAERSLRDYDPGANGVAADLRVLSPPRDPIIALGLDPKLPDNFGISEAEFADLVTFVRDGLLDPRALPAHLCGMVPATVPSGMSIGTFQGC
jgi:cytochrome c peroxidase